MANSSGDAWTLLTGHGHVLVAIAKDPQARIRDLSQEAGLTERAIQTILRDLETAGYITRRRTGNRTTYTVHADRGFRHQSQEGLPIGPFLRLLAQDASRWSQDPGEARPGGDGRVPDDRVKIDGIVLLKQDHKLIKDLFRRFEKTGPATDAAVRRDLAEQIRAALVAHSFIEETIFYPAARSADPDCAAHVLESVEGHHVVTWLLYEVGSLDPQDETFQAKMALLIEIVRHHIAEEEDGWFPAVRKALGRNRLTELGAQMAAAKPAAPTEPLALASAKR